MKANKKIIYGSLILLMSLLLGSVAVAKQTNWYTNQLAITPQANATLIAQQQYIWNTTKWWQDKNCYYFDLYIGNETNITWQDTNRELTCTKQTLIQSDIDTLEANNAAWTLQQLGVAQVVSQPVTTITSTKMQNLKTGKTYDNGVAVN